MRTVLEQVAADVRDRELSGRVRSFADVGRAIALAKNGNPAEIAERAGLPRQVRNILNRTPQAVYSLSPQERMRLRAAVAAGSSSDATWAAPLADYDSIASAFLQSLRNFGCFDALLPFMRQYPMRVRVGASTVGITGTTIGQVMVKPISRLTLTATTLTEEKAVAIIAVSEELARFSAQTAGDLFERELAAGVATETDSRFITLLSAGATALGSGGFSAEHAYADLRAMLAAITTSQASVLFLLMTSSIAKALSTLHTSTGGRAFPNMTYAGGEIAGLRAIVSDGMPSATLILVDATQVAANGSDPIRLDMSEYGVVAMDTAPDSPPSASTVLMSLWQYNYVGLRAERFFGASKLTTTGVVVMSNFAPVGDSPGP
jgi:hypothetical protein